MGILRLFSRTGIVIMIVDIVFLEIAASQLYKGFACPGSHPPAVFHHLHMANGHGEDPQMVNLVFKGTGY